MPSLLLGITFISIGHWHPYTVYYRHNTTTTTTTGSSHCLYTQACTLIQGLDQGCH
jgi:hypothetical protein